VCEVESNVDEVIDLRDDISFEVEEEESRGSRAEGEVREGRETSWSRAGRS